MTIALLVATVAAGYLLGRTQPWRRLRDRCWWTILAPKPGRHGRIRVVACMAVNADAMALVWWRQRRRGDQPARKHVPDHLAHRERP